MDTDSFLTSVGSEYRLSSIWLPAGIWRKYIRFVHSCNKRMAHAAFGISPDGTAVLCLLPNLTVTWKCYVLYRVMETLQIQRCCKNVCSVITEDYQHRLRYSHQIGWLLIFEDIFNLTRTALELRIRWADIKVTRLKRKMKYTYLLRYHILKQMFLAHYETSGI